MALNIRLLSKSFSKAPYRSIRLFVISPVLIGLSLILTAAVAAPYFETRFMVQQYQTVYSNLGYICHQFPSRSFHLFGSNIGICSRCFSIYSAILFSSMLLVFYNVRPTWRFRFFIPVLLAVPLLVDGVTQLYGFRESNNFLRLLTGVLFGMSVTTAFVSPYINFAVFLTTSIFKKDGLIMKNLCCKTSMALLLAILIQLPSLVFAEEITIKA